MSELWRQSLGRLQSDFERGANEYPPLACLLIETTIPRQCSVPEDDAIPNVYELAGKPLVMTQAVGARGFAIETDPSGRPKIGKKQVFDAYGKPFENTAGEPFAVKLGASRVYSIYGDADAAREFDRSAVSAGQSLCGVPRTRFSLIDGESLAAAGEPHASWLAVLFDLAWASLPGSPLTAEKRAWKGNGSVRLDELPELRRQNVVLQMLPHLADFPDDRFYSLLPDLFRASVLAIDVLRGGSEPRADIAADDSGLSTPPPEQGPKAIDGESHLSPAKLAELFHVPQEPLRSRLQRWRAKNHEGWIENSDRKPREAQYLYRVGSVRHIIDQLIATSQATSERPTKKTDAVNADD